jgi:hypothetical protein
MLDTAWAILKNYNWEKERFDCDNRADWVSSFCSLHYRINSCHKIFCEIYNVTTGILVDRHYTNIIVDNDSNVYLFDVDNGGQKKKIESGKEIIMGNWRYKFISAEIS